MEQKVKVHSGMKIDRNPHYEPVEIFRVDKDKIRVHTLDGVECVDAGGWDNHVPFVTDYVPYLDDDETEDGEVKIGFSKEPFDLSKVLCSTNKI